MKKQRKSSAKKTTVIGDLRIPLHAVKAIHTFLDSRPVLPFEKDEPGFPKNGPADPDAVRKVTGNELVIVVDITKLQEQIMFTEYFRTRQKPRSPKKR